ncbi:amidase [Paraburkholderia phytofirmans]|uniref:amidase n=1 Tax=Paraburkholderia sp. BL9I2N2 TaxID=1938809 RepID=UPI0010481BF8|nr:amidase [Paraburkholderia sp. BL9I2N2]TCK88767.1 amidase [Paraburkholderia sp. BL9I2N2]
MSTKHNGDFLQAKGSTTTLPGEIWRWRAVDIAAQVRAGSVSCAEVLQAFHQRIDSINPRLNAIVHADRKQAIETANRADDLLRTAPHEAGILHGVPLTIKLNVDVAGEATTNGVPAYAARVAPADSSVVANLRNAGANIIGRSNVPPFSFRWFTDNPLHGRTLNPWREDITSGGSSGGAGVSVATGMCALAHGTDIAGSIRYPAYVNGVVGLRTTPGRVPAYHPTTGHRFYGLQSMSAQGPLARSVTDVLLGLRAMIAADTRDPTWVDARLEHPDDFAPVKVALIDEIPGTSVCAEIKAALQQAATALAAAGYIVERALPPVIEQCVEVWQSIVMTESRLGMIAGVDAIGDADIKRSVHNMADCGPTVDLNGYVRAIARRDVLRRKWNEFLGRYPIALLPVSCRLPQTWGADLGTVDEMRALVAAQSPLIATAALGLPGISVPTGLSGGLPVGVQLVADSFRELRLLTAASVIESNVGVTSALDYRAD